MQTYFELLKLPFPADQAGILNRLAQDRLVDFDKGAYSIRRLTGLLLARRLTDFPTEIARKAPRVVVYQGVSKLSTRLDQPGTKGYAVGFQGLINFIMAQLPQNEVIEDAIRKQVKLVSDVAIRELVANALIHQDLGVVGSSVMIEIFDDRVEISNPGEPVVLVDRFIDGYQSRNERLADLARRMGICEEKGSGVDRVVSIAEEFQLPAPDFRTGSGRTSAIVFGPAAFEDLDREGRVRACYQHCCLRYITSQKTTNQSVRNRFKLSEDKAPIASQILASAVEAGKIKLADASQTSTRYRSYLPFWA